MNDQMIYVNDGGDGQSPSTYKLETVKNERNNGVIKMSYYENDLNWTPFFRGKKCAKLKDNGDSITIKLHNKKITVDYDEAIELVSILRYYTEDSEINHFKNHLTKFKEV